MILHISEQSADTLQEQIIGQIRARILSGELEADYGLPSIRALAKSLRVSVITVQRAYEQLLNEEIIYARRGKGCFVATLQQSVKSELAENRFAQQLSNQIEMARRDGLDDQAITQIFEQTLQAGDKQDGNA